MSAKYTSCRWFECMDRPLALPELISCVGQRYAPYPYCGLNINPPADVRQIVGSCYDSGDGIIETNCGDYQNVGDTDKCGHFFTGDDGNCHMYAPCFLPVFEYRDP